MALLTSKGKIWSHARTGQHTVVYCVPEDSVTIGGRKYPFIKVGNQLWTTENLDWKESNITFDPEGTPGQDMPVDEACWYYWRDEGTYGVTGNKYGLLYNGYARDYFINSGVLPNGWHIPSIDEFKTLANSLGGMYVAGKKLKSKTGWNGTDEVGFNALPAGYRRGNSSPIWDYSGVGSVTWFWTSNNDINNENCPQSVQLDSSDGITIDYWHTQYSYGSIRLVKNIA